MNLNILRQLMQFYDQNGPQVPVYSGGFSMGDAGAAQNEATRAGNRLNFALSHINDMGASQFPGAAFSDHYFTGNVPSYVAPSVQRPAFNPPQGQQAPLARETINYLLPLLGRR